MLTRPPLPTVAVLPVATAMPHSLRLSTPLPHQLDMSTPQPVYLYGPEFSITPFSDVWFYDSCANTWVDETADAASVAANDVNGPYYSH